MNVILVMQEVLLITNPVVGESALPDFAFATEDFAEGVGVSAFDELDGVLDRHVLRGREQKMNVLGHQNEGMEVIAAFAAIAIQSFQKETGVVFDNEKTATSPGRECDEIGSGRGDEASGFQEQTSAAGSRVFCLG